MLSFAREDDHRRCAWFRNGPSFGKSRWLYTPAVRSSGGDPSDARQLSALLRASPLLSQQVLQSRIVEHCVRKTASASRSRLPASSASWLRTRPCAELRFPFIDAGIADAVLAAKLRDRRACLELLQYPDNLFVRETIALHSLVLSMGQRLLQNGLVQRAKVNLVMQAYGVAKEPT